MAPAEWTPPLATYVPIEEQAEEDLEWMKVALEQVSLCAALYTTLCEPANALLYQNDRINCITMLMGFLFIISSRHNPTVLRQKKPLQLKKCPLAACS
jgi:hypothetical protein